MTDGRIGEQALEVVPEQRDDRAEQQGHQPGAADPERPFRRSREHRKQAGQQEHAGLHHSGGVQVGRDRRGRRHGVRQPEVERELRRLGERTEQHQRQHRGVARIGAHRVAAREHRGQLVAAGDLAEQQKTRQQRQPARAGDRERHARAAPRRRAPAPVGDQQERRQAGELPEDQQLDEVFRQHHAQHRTHEQQQTGIEPPEAVLRRQVVMGIEDDQQADAEDQQREQQPETVEAEREVEAGGGNPRQPLDRGGAGKACREQRYQPQGRQSGHRGGAPRRRGSPATRGPGDQRRTEEGRQHRQQQAHGAVRPRSRLQPPDVLSTPQRSALYRVGTVSCLVRRSGSHSTAQDVSLKPRRSAGYCMIRPHELSASRSWRGP